MTQPWPNKVASLAAKTCPDHAVNLAQLASNVNVFFQKYSEMLISEALVFQYPNILGLKFEKLVSSGFIPRYSILILDQCEHL